MGLTKTSMWIISAFVIVFTYWELTHSRGAYLSDCHWADIQIITNKVICLECKKSCKLVQGWTAGLGFDMEIVNEVLETNENEE